MYHVVHVERKFSYYASSLGCYTGLQVKNTMRSASVSNIVTMENMSDKHVLYGNLFLRKINFEDLVEINILKFFAWEGL